MNVEDVAKAEPLILTLADLARRAGKITLDYYQTDLKIDRKSDFSPVTEAHRNTHTFLRAEIATLFPGDTVVGEEFGETNGVRGGRRWIIDPIDGTKAFIHGVPLFGVMIGIEEKREMIAG